MLVSKPESAGSGETMAKSLIGDELRQHLPISVLLNNCLANV
jgi:hypothetical protein